MGRITIQSGGLRLGVEPSLGAGIAELSLRSPAGDFVPLWRRAGDVVGRFNDLASYLLVPWCNRIAGGSFEFDGRHIDLPADWPDGTAIHGLVKDKPFTILDRSPVSARLGFESRDHADDPGVRAWPWPFRCVARYELDETSLIQDVRLTNLGGAPMPGGIGFHPYFMRALWDARDEVRVRLNVSGRYPCEGMIPSGPARADDVTSRLALGGPLDTLELDDVFAGFDGAAVVTWPASAVRARFECTANLGHAVVYSPLDRAGPAPRPRDFFCLEPVSMVNDGFSLMARGQGATGVLGLSPGETVSVRFRLVVERQ